MSLDSLRPLASDLFENWGKAVTLRRETSEFDPETGQMVTSTDDYDVVGAPPESYRQENIDGTLVQQSDLKQSIAADGLTVTPKTTDALLVDGTEYTIVSVTPVYFGDALGMYTLQVRA